MPALSLSSSVDGPVQVLRASGDVDQAAARRLCNVVIRGLQSGPVVVDLSEVQHLEPSALGSLQACYRASLGAAGPVVFACASATVAQMLTTAGLRDELPLSPSVAAASRSVRDLAGVWTDITARPRRGATA